jgi:hypothetical protein
MTSRDFCYWLQGHFEISDAKALGERETEMVKRHLALVFKHEIDPSMPDKTGELQAIHDGLPFPPKTSGPGSTLLRC